MVKDAEVARQCEEILIACLTAINDRKFDTSAAPWTSLSQDFKMSFSSGTDRATTRQEHVRAFKEMTDEWPDFHISIIDMSVQVYQDAGYAEIHLNAESSGSPGLSPGMSRRTFSVHEFRNRDGAWVATKQTVLPGMG